MLEIKYVDGDTEIFELAGNDPTSIVFMENAQAYIIPCVDGSVIIPISFIKCLRYKE